MTSDRRATSAVVGICLLCALLNGLAGFDAHSNHPTYLPPALQQLDPTFLANDWWLASASHYHVAFFALATCLAFSGVLEWGLAVLNVVVVAAALFAIHRIATTVYPSRSIAILVFVTALMLCTRSFYSAGDSYLFSASLQPSSIGAMATLWAIANYLEKRLLIAGVWLALGGLFHTNFLLANLLLFGLVQAMAVLDVRAPWKLTERASLISFARLLGPSLVLLAAFLPLILSVAGDDLTSGDAEAADWIFFHFAVPFHYLPASNPAPLMTLASWQALGLVWTPLAVAPGELRRRLWLLQSALVVTLWSATFLTTAMFVPQISRLFLWRLAPFAVIFAATIFASGALRQIAGDNGASRPPSAALLIAVSLICSLVLTLPGGGLEGQIIQTRPFSPVVYPLLAVLLFLGLRWWGKDLPRVPANLMLVGAFAALGWGFLTQPGDRERSRYSLIAQTALERNERALFAFVRSRTDADARFVTPPDLEKFRLEAQRSVIVDLKALPLNRSGLIEWYKRLSAVSGVDAPVSTQDVIDGYGRIDSERLATLDSVYRIDFAVIRTEHGPAPSGWRTVFINDRYKVIAPPVASH